MRIRPERIEEARQKEADERTNWQYIMRRGCGRGELNRTWHAQTECLSLGIVTTTQTKLLGDGLEADGCEEECL